MPPVGTIAREGGRCEFHALSKSIGENRKMLSSELTSFSAPPLKLRHDCVIVRRRWRILLRSIEISRGEEGGWRSLISKGKGGGIRNVVLPKTRRDCRSVFRAIRNVSRVGPQPATFLNSIMHPRILAVFRVSFSTSFSSFQLGRRSLRRYLIGPSCFFYRRNSRGGIGYEEWR